MLCVKYVLHTPSYIFHAYIIALIILEIFHSRTTNKEPCNISLSVDGG